MFAAYLASSRFIFFTVCRFAPIKEGDDRKEEKPDYIIEKLHPENYQKLMKEWEQKFLKN